MARKTYRPKVGYESMLLTRQMADGAVLSVSSWPYATEDGEEQRVLGKHPWLTDAPAKSQAQKKKEEG